MDHCGGIFAFISVAFCEIRIAWDHLVLEEDVHGREMDAW
jgi:hypothetical protein